MTMTIRLFLALDALKVGREDSLYHMDDYPAAVMRLVSELHPKHRELLSPINT